MPAETILTRDFPEIPRERDPLFYFTLLFLSFIQGLFKQRPEGEYKYSEDENITEIIIADQVTAAKETVPRIITARGPANYITLFCDDMVKRSLKKDERKRTSLLSIPMTINCIAKLGIEAQELAFFIAHNIWSHRVLLQQHGIHKIDRNFSISPETPTDAIFAPSVVPEGIMVSLVVPFIVRWTVTTVPNNAPKLREIDNYITKKLAPTLKGIDTPETPLPPDLVISREFS